MRIDAIDNIFLAMTREFEQEELSAVLICFKDPETMSIRAVGDKGSLAGVLVATLKDVLQGCNQEQRDIAKGLILKEIFNQ